jgi:hypothetical protein
MSQAITKFDDKKDFKTFAEFVLRSNKNSINSKNTLKSFVKTKSFKQLVLGKRTKGLRLNVTNIKNENVSRIEKTDLFVAFGNFLNKILAKNGYKAKFDGSNEYLDPQDWLLENTLWDKREVNGDYDIIINDCGEASEQKEIEEIEPEFDDLDSLDKDGCEIQDSEEFQLEGIEYLDPEIESIEELIQEIDDLHIKLQEEFKGENFEEKIEEQETIDEELIQEQKEQQDVLESLNTNDQEEVLQGQDESEELEGKAKEKTEEKDDLETEEENKSERDIEEDDDRDEKPSDIDILNEEEAEEELGQKIDYESDEEQQYPQQDPLNLSKINNIGGFFTDYSSTRLGGYDSTKTQFFNHSKIVSLQKFDLQNGRVI